MSRILCAFPTQRRVHATHFRCSCTRRATSRVLSVPSCASVTAAEGVSTAAAARPERGRQSLPDVVSILRERGLIQDVTNDELQQVAVGESLAVYCGFDPTADSLHLGNLLGIIVLSWFQRCGHRPVALLGGATGRVGDPSGRSTERPVLTEAVIESNVTAIGQLLGGILSRNNSTPCSGSEPPKVHEVQVVNNLDWFGSMSLLSFLRDIGKFARVGTMIAKDSVRTRMESESGISYTEFTYQLLQGYDFVHLYKQHGVRVQVGGSDQWGNITAGTDLVRRLLGSQTAPGPATESELAAPGAGQSTAAEGPASCFGLTFPLLVDSEGRKFGKSVGGAIWLNAAKLSPYKFYQHLFNTPDADVIKFLKMLTFLPLEEVEAVAAAMGQTGYMPNTAQRRLAEEVTRFVHGEEGLAQALRATEALRPGAETALDAASLAAVAGDVPSVALQRAEVQGMALVDLLLLTRLQPSKGAARKLIAGGGVYLNNVKVADVAAVVRAEDMIEGRVLLLAAGKKNKLLVNLT
ncbi:hypothetical protein V8C86DRAFT_2637554 [Haematococcus lacustris]